MSPAPQRPPALVPAFIGKAPTPSVRASQTAGVFVPPLPSGVTLQAIDGGPTYYASNGFTFAADATFNGMSWDDPRFFPIGDDFCFYPANYTTSGLATFHDLGLNFTHRCTSDTDMSVLRSNGIWALLDGPNTNYGAETFGWHVEEPDTWNQAGDANSIASQVGGFGTLTGRVLQASFTWNQLYFQTISGAPGNSDMGNVMGSSVPGISPARHLNIPGDDLYYFAGSGVAAIQAQGGNVEQNTASATTAQMARGTNYGDMIDIMRNDWLGSAPAVGAPVMAAYIETEDGLVTGGREIVPAELNWAAWSTIIHGARGLIYFGTTSNFGSGPTFGFSQTALTGQTISGYTQAKNTHRLITNLARIINSPFALAYATVSPAAYVFPTALASPGNSVFNGWTTTGIDIMVKYYTSGSFTNSAGTFGNGFYIFATYRGNESASSISATFTTADHFTGTVSAINADGGSSSYGTAYTVQAVNGQFTDTFTSGSSVRIYGVN